MGKIYHTITELIGKTPLLELKNYEKKYRLPAIILAKLEYFNPTGSVKDRAAMAMIEAAEQSGLLKPGTTIIEPTSGNTGIGLAAIGASKGYRVLLTMPDTMSAERRTLLQAYGAELILTEGSKGMAGAIEKAISLSQELPDSFLPSQFENPANPAVHAATTGPELWADTDGNIDFLVAGVGSGGTLTGTGAYLKGKNPKLKVIAIEPASSPVLSTGKGGPHKIQGIGAGFVPKTLDVSVYDEVLCITDEDALKTGRELAQGDGILVGISSGAAVYGAALLANRPENIGKTIVAILPDSGDRYLSSAMFSD